MIVFEVQDQALILKRISSRLKRYGEHVNNGVVIDFSVHLLDEIERLMDKIETPEEFR